MSKRRGGARRGASPPPLPGGSKAGPDEARASFLKDTLLILGVALAVRGVHLWQLSSAPVFALIFGDGRSYDTWGQEISAGDWFGSEVFYQAPLYPYFLGLIYATLGRDIMVVKICQALVSAASAVFVGLAGWRLFGRRIGMVSGMLFAVSAPVLFSSAEIQKSVLDIFLVSLLLWLVTELIHQPTRTRTWLAAGVALGALSLSRENALVFLLPLLAWVFVEFRARRRQLFVAGGAFVAGLALVLVPVATRNFVGGGDFALTTSQMGPNFYIGNNPDADGTYRPLVYGQADAAFERTDATRLAEDALGRRLTPSEVSSYWMNRGLDYVFSQPGDWLALMAKKSALLWNAVEAVDTESQYTHAESSLLLKLSGYLTHFGVVAPLALLGIWVTWPRRTQLWMVYAMLAIYAASVLAFYVFTRYRYPMLPFLVVFAAVGLVELPRLIRDRSAPGVMPCIALTALFAVFANWPILSKTSMRAATSNTYGTALRDLGQMDEAVSYYQEALVLSPDYATAHNNLGIVLRAQGDIEAATTHHREAVRLEPSGAAHYNLANVLAAQGIGAEAVEHYRRSLEFEPGLVGALNNLGLLLRAQGNLDEAEASFREVLQRAPNDVTALRNLAKVAEARRDFPAAVEQYRRILALTPEDSETVGALGMVLMSQGDIAESVAVMNQGLEDHPDSPGLHNTFGLVLANAARLDEAIVHFRRAVEIAPEFTEAHASLALALGAAGNLEEAVEHFQDVVRLDPDNANAYNRLGLMLGSLDRIDEAAEAFQRAVDLDPANPEARANLAMAQEMLRNP